MKENEIVENQAEIFKIIYEELLRRQVETDPEIAELIYKNLDKLYLEEKQNGDKI